MAEGQLGRFLIPSFAFVAFLFLFADFVLIFHEYSAQTVVVNQDEDLLWTVTGAKRSTNFLCIGNHAVEIVHGNVTKEKAEFFLVVMPVNNEFRLITVFVGFHKCGSL